MQTQANLFQSTARVWFQSISLSAVLISIFMVFDNYNIHNIDGFVNAMVNGRLMNGVLYSGAVFLVVGTFGLPALFASYFGFKCLSKLKLKEHAVRPLMIMMSMAILSATFLSILNIAHISTPDAPIIGIFFFATTFILMLDNNLVKAISAEA